MVFASNWAILVLLLIIFTPTFLVTYGIYHSIYNHKIYILKISCVLLGVIFCSIYYIYCRYFDQQKIAYYCIDKQCISIIHFYKNSSINSPMYVKIYKGKILFRIQAKFRNHTELLMEDDILIGKKPLDNKFIIYGSMPVIHNNVSNIKIKEINSYTYNCLTDYIVSRDLKFRYLY